MANCHCVLEQTIMEDAKAFVFEPNCNGSLYIMHLTYAELP